MLYISLNLVLFDLALGASALEFFTYANFAFDTTYSIANQLGFFPAYGLNVLTGGYDILSGTVDNVINRRFDSNIALTVLGQLDYGPDLVYAENANITSFARLRGKPIIVDSPVSGFAFFLRKILSVDGLSLENGDYSFQTVGATSKRYADLVAEALSNGSAVYSTILNSPFTSYGQVLPDSSRPNILARVSDYVNPIVSSVFTIRQNSVSNAAKSARLTNFLAAMYTANRLLQDAKNKECVIKAIKKQSNVTDTVAEKLYAAAPDSITGEHSTGGNFTVDRLGLLNVIDIRSQFGGFASVSSTFNYSEAIIPGPEKMVDYTIRDAALKLFQTSLLKVKC